MLRALALFLLTAQASAGTPAPLLDLVTAAKGLWNRRS